MRLEEEPSSAEIIQLSRAHPREARPLAAGVTIRRDFALTDFG